MLLFYFRLAIAFWAYIFFSIFASHSLIPLILMTPHSTSHKYCELLQIPPPPTQPEAEPAYAAAASANFDVLFVEIEK